MALQLHRKFPKLLKILTVSIVIATVLECIICPNYTKSLFKSLANKSFFPDYNSSDISYVKQLYGNLYFDYYDNSNLIMIEFALDFSTDVYLEIYISSSECEEAFWFYVDDYPNGYILENTDDFKVFVSKKDFSVLNLETDQHLFVKNGNSLYNISKYSFLFTQKDFKKSILLMTVQDQSQPIQGMETKQGTQSDQSGDGSMIEP